ncbi:MAG: phosphatidylglycerophosphatase A [Deltaproteobacteria bacterium]|nr:phosphatidylglycerophosphatase A [Deltaproteobacteria bacterium]
MRKSFAKAGASGKVALVLATWFGVGFLPKAPGTFATLAALPLVVILNRFGAFWGSLLLLAFLLLAFWSADQAGKMAGRNDPQEIVVDEVAGFLVTLFLAPQTWLSLALGVALFRVFDIWKPFPVRTAERIRGGAGILMDDIAAGVYANLCLRAILLVW